MNRPLKSLAALTCLSTLFAYACAAEETSPLDPATTGGPGATSTGMGGGTGAGGPAVTSSGEGGGQFTTSSAGGSGQGGSCVDLEFEAEFVKRPSDIIFMIDNSGSMSQEITAVEQNINVNFANIIGSSGIDYRVIMVTDHGSSNLEVCVGPPLSGTTNCSAAPVEVPGQFYHYDVNVQSWDSVCTMMDTLYGSQSGGEPDEAGLYPAGWAQFLRPEAVKVFVVLSDDRMACSWSAPGVINTFDSSCDPTPSNPNLATRKACYNDGSDTTQTASASQAAYAAQNFRDRIVQIAPSQFGAMSGGQNFLFYTVACMAPNPMPNGPAGEGYLPSAPIVDGNSGTCTGCASPGTGYQWLSKGTDALRFPMCSMNYDAVFQAIAAGVEEGTSIPCEFTIPETEDPIADDTWAVEYTPGDGGSTEQFDLVASEGACQDDDEFYVDGDILKLCPLACNKVSSDSNADINVIALCAGTID